MVGSFKGIIQIEPKETKEKYKADKKREVRKLINYVKKISYHTNGEELKINLEEMASSEKRNLLDLELREIQCDYL